MTDTTAGSEDLNAKAAAYERIYEWHDPAALADAVRQTDGLKLLSALAEGRVHKPPVAATLGFEAIEFGDGRAVFELVPTEWQYNPLGTVHGGVLTTLADSAMGCAVHTKLKAGVGYTTLELKINFTRAVTADTGSIRCEAQVITFGRRVATAEARLTDSRQRTVGHASTTCLILS